MDPAEPAKMGLTTPEQYLQSIVLFVTENAKVAVQWVEPTVKVR
jgi:hypothetical protein